MRQIGPNDRDYLPEFVNIEVTNHCNMRCIICPHGHDLIKKKGYMDLAIYKKIIDEMKECSGWQPARINIVGVGESLLHPGFMEMANYSKQAGFTQILTTNAFFLTESKTDEIVDEHLLDHIEISFDDGDENYARYKGGRIYDIIIKNIVYFLKKNRDIKVRIKFIQYNNNSDDFVVSEHLKKEFNSPNVTFVAYELSSWSGTMDMGFVDNNVRYAIFAKLREKPLKVKCNSGANMGMFSWDGSVRSCYLDYNSEHTFGNVRDENTIDILLGKERRLFVDNISHGRHVENWICKDCLAPYNRLDQKVVMETSDGARQTTKGSQWDAHQNL